MSGNQKHKSTSYEKRAAYPPGRVPPPGKNRLVFEKSPYLLQHAENAVDWYPWGNEAFAKARAENKPVFLSIGYSTCHWCHVMERESFEDTEVAALLNDVFVCIKVDREERPDIDNVYMTVCQMLTGRGGWPLTIMMAPDKRPFFAATYLPKPAMMNMIPSVKAAWTNNRSRIFADAGRLLEALERETSHPAGGVVGRKETNDAYEQLAGRFDGDYGGFGGAPKFPTPHNLLFLLRYWKRTSDGRALQMVEKTLKKMRRGGVYDHVGFGFHRYSTDARWFLPHFEKMLYDQALLAMAYTEAYQATSKAEYAQTAREIFTYVLRDMTSDGGAFYSAEDADSEGEEGKFYLWTRSELDDVLGAEDGELAAALYGVAPSGNWTEEATGHRPGTNILHVEKTTTERAQFFGVEESRLRERLEGIRRKLFAAREERAHPHKDDKILTDWNALMIAALAKASRAFGDPGLATSAKSAAEFILREMKNPRGGLFHRYRDGEASIAAMADDYAFWVWALLELYETTFDVSYLKEAIATDDYFLKHFWDEQDGGFFFNSDEGETLIVRSKEVYDGAIPSANSVAKMNLARIGRMTGESKYEARAVGIGRAFHARLSAQASAFTMMMSAVEFVTGPSCEVVIVGGPKDEDTQAMAAALEKTYVPNKVVILRPAGDGGKDIVALAPFTKSLSAVDGKATAYVCRNHACELPTTDVYKMIQLLDDTMD